MMPVYRCHLPSLMAKLGDIQSFRRPFLTNVRITGFRPIILSKGMGYRCCFTASLPPWTIFFFFKGSTCESSLVTFLLPHFCISFSSSALNKFIDTFIPVPQVFKSNPNLTIECLLTELVPASGTYNNCPATILPSHFNSAVSKS